MKTYSNPLVITYSWGSLNFVSGAAAFQLMPPHGCDAGRVEDIHVRVTTTFTDVTTPAYVRVGTGADADKYAELNVAETASAASINASAADIKSNIHLTADGITYVTATVVAPTGEASAGVGLLDIAIAWWA